MKTMIMIAALALIPGIISAEKNADLNSLGKNDVSAAETAGLEIPDVSKANKIVGGDAAAKGEFSFIVSLQDFGGHFCGGSLIKKDWVLTAEHCVVDGIFSIVTGLHDLRQTAGTESFKVDRIVPHPLRLGRDYDYALVHLAGASKFQPIQLNREELTGEADLLVAGWGDTSEAGAVAENILQKVTVPLVSAERCSVAYPGKITDRMICAGYDAGGKDACQGDSGGPLFTGSGEERTLVGVVSWGKGCARPGMYGVYSKVNAVTEWIESVINE